MPSAIKSMDGVHHGFDQWNIEPEKIHIRPGFNPRGIPYEELYVDDLKDFIRANGVRPLPALRVCLRTGRIELVMGHRRLKAIRELIAEGEPIKTVACQQETILADDKLLALAISENQGLALTPIQEAEAYKRLLNYNWTVEEIARNIGKSAGHIYDRLRLTEAEIEIRQAIQDGSVTLTDAVAVIKEASKTGGDQKIILKKRQATKVDKRVKSARDIPIEQRIWDELCPLVIKYGAEMVYEVLESHTISESVEE